MISITAWISIAERIFVVAALGFVVWWIHSSGEDHLRVKDMAAVQDQLTKNARLEASNAQIAQQAQVQHDEDLQDIAARIANQRAPVFMCNRSPDTSAVSDHPAPTQRGNDPTQSGSADAGAGVDIRGAINAFEKKYESALADCRKVVASWPH